MLGVPPAAPPPVPRVPPVVTPPPTPVAGPSSEPVQPDKGRETRAKDIAPNIKESREAEKAESNIGKKIARRPPLAKLTGAPMACFYRCFCRFQWIGCPEKLGHFSF